MTKQEKLADKWRALSNPQSIEDYSVTMTLEEAAQVPEALAELEKYIPLTKVFQPVSRP